VRRLRGSRPSRRSVAFAPGHVTGFFVPDVTARDPRARGSIGAGLVLELGVTASAEWYPRESSRTVVAADIPGRLPISQEVARRLVPPHSGRVTVRLAHQMPVGQGFGMSAAGALATALAVAGLFQIPRRRAVEVAHLAELFGGGGLGGVAAISGGGLEFRVRAGLPPEGRITHRPFSSPILVGVVGGPMPSPRVLRDPRILRRISDAARHFPPKDRPLSATGFLSTSERFTDRVGLTSPPLARTLRTIRSEGGWAAQAMFGRSFFAVPQSRSARTRILFQLQSRGIRVVELSAARKGALLQPNTRPVPR
jgi:pantoate kinase